MKEKLFLLIGKGEGEEIEFKRNERSVIETVCAFANTFGGYVIVGVDDKGKIIGIRESTEEKISNYLHALNPYPTVKIHPVIVDGKRVLLIEVKKSKSLIFYGNRAYIRVGRSNRPLSLDEMIERSVELTALNFDTLPSPYDKHVIRKEYVKWYLERRDKMRNIPPRGNYEENLKKLKILVKKNGKYRVSYGGILFFTDNPEEFIEGASLRIIDFRGGESIKIFVGPVWKIIDESYSYLLKTLKLLDLRIGARREKILEYPEYALREAIINALAHRNYLIHADVRVFIHDDKIVIRSPGSFPPGVSVEHPEHHPRNPLLCLYLYDMGYIERYGFGIQRIKESCESHPFCNLKYEITPSKVDVILSKSRWVIDEVDQKIVAMIKNNPMSSSEIARNVGMSKVAVLTRLKKLISLGEVRKIGSGPATRYIS